MRCATKDATAVPDHDDRDCATSCGVCATRRGNTPAAREKSRGTSARRYAIRVDAAPSSGSVLARYAVAMIRFQRILCAVDFSQCSQHALDEAIAIAHLYDAAITVLTVFPQAIASDPFAGLPEFQPFRLTDHHRAHLFRHLKTFAEREGAEASRMEYAVREGVGIHAGILEAAEQ